MRMAAETIGYNTFDELAKTYDELKILRGRAHGHWPPGSGSRRKLGPVALIDADYEDLMEDFADYVRQGERLLRRSRKFVGE